MMIVCVYVYDLNVNYNDFVYLIGFGIYYLVVEIYDWEYVFGYYDDANVIGVFDIVFKSVLYLVKYWEMIEIGMSLLMED